VGLFHSSDAPPVQRGHSGVMVSARPLDSPESMPQ
jgi:hypothetical protein